MTDPISPVRPAGADASAPAFNAEALRAHVARVAPEWRIAHKPKGPSRFGLRIASAAQALAQLFQAINRRPAPTYAPGEPLDPLLELRENPRMLRSVIADISAGRKKLGRLPRVMLQGGDEPRIVTVADSYLAAAGSVWNADAAQYFLEQTQKYDPLDLEEIWAFPSALRFLLLEEIIAQAAGVIKDPGSHNAAGAAALKARMTSLRDLGYADWISMIEKISVYHRILAEDPANAYLTMDFESREAYRKRVAEIARHSDCTESDVARAAVELARLAAGQEGVGDPRLRARRAHLGYYLIDRGFPRLASRTGYRPPFLERIRSGVRRNADDFYIGGFQVLTVVLIGLILAPLTPTYPIFGGLTWAFLLLLLPATQGAVDLLNNAVTALFKAHALPKLDLEKGVPADCTTLVAVPTLLIDEKQVRKLFEDLEVRYLGNEDPNIHFGLLTDLPDSITRPRDNDTDPLVDLAFRLTEDLNRRYAPARAGGFFLLHRHRIFNARQGVWMGWERKRGKLLDLNKFLQGEYDPFPVKSGDLKALRSARYVITLDSDTQLPRGVARAMIGAIAHPLNRAIVDPQLRIVTEGYGILQPRVGVSVQSASRSRLASIYSGQTGFDIYTRAISDVYQELYGEGIFTGKGIYEIKTLHAVLDRRFPRNSLLSHDLIEGAYSRAGLVTDIEVIDDYPSHYSAYTRRRHRWVRGDWQIAQWLFGKVPDESGKYQTNPISTISRWKIFDNLRRSLVETFTFALLLAGWLGLPGGAEYWTAVTLFLLFVPALVQLVFSLGRACAATVPGAMRDAFGGFWQGFFIALLNLAFLPHQTLLALDAITRSLVRSFITGQRLLEWETAAEAEARGKANTPVDRYLAATPLLALLVGVLVLAYRPRALPFALPILVLWACAGAITAWLNQTPRETRPRLSGADQVFLRRLALRTWRYFAEFGGESHNYLIPDNVEEKDLFEAARVSPTNLGLLINARQAAVAFGYLTAPEFVSLSRNTLASYARLEKYRGHVFNWYDTRSMKPIPPRTISSVDNGNLAASLYTLRAGCEALLRAPLLSPSLFTGIRDHWDLLASLPELPAGVGPQAPPAALPAPAAETEAMEADSAPMAEEAGAGYFANVNEWIAWAVEAARPAHFAPPESGRTNRQDANPDAKPEASWWHAEFRRRAMALATLVSDYMPWLLPEFLPLRKAPQLQGMEYSAAMVSIGGAADFAGELDARVSRAAAIPSGDSPSVVMVEQLRLLLQPARRRLESLKLALQDLAAEAMRDATEMDFGFLVNRSRQVLSIGYEFDRMHLHQACYDLLASEARMAAFIAVAKGEATQESWFKLGRTHTVAAGRAVLISWTGTMFEYLMPALWMRTYPDTLMARTLKGVVAVQRAFGRERRIPWGISECGCARTDQSGHYHYQAFGIPAISLKWDAVAGPVVSPYSTCLALGVDCRESLRNLKHMAKLGWIGAYGFYEAADYQPPAKKPQLVREWMAHHQGMSLLAILNLLNDNIVQRWFHANPHLQATQLLLQERPFRDATLKAEHNATQALAKTG